MAHTHDKAPNSQRRKANVTRRWLIFGGIFTILIVVVLFVLSPGHIIPAAWSNSITALFAVLGFVFALLSVFPISPPTPVSPPAQASLNQKMIYHNLAGIPPFMESRITLPRREAVRKIYETLIQPDVTTVALTGVGGVGKTWLAALVCDYAEEQRQAGNGPFNTEILWLQISHDVAMIGLAGTILKAQGQSTEELSSLVPKQQIEVLFNALNIAGKARLIVLDQFEQLLNEQGDAREDIPGIGEWIDLINTRPCICRILITSRLRPLGTSANPLGLIREIHNEGLTTTEGIELLRKQEIGATEEELHEVVENSGDNPLVLTQIASLVRERSIRLDTLLDSSKTISYAFGQSVAQLDQLQYELLLAFSVYREPVPLDAVMPLLDVQPLLQDSIHIALDKLQMLSLLSLSKGDYRVHPLISEYIDNDFIERNRQTNEKRLEEMHAAAAKYYLQQATVLQKQGQNLNMHFLIEAVWQLLQAGQQEGAYNLARQEKILQYLLSKEG